MRFVEGRVIPDSEVSYDCDFSNLTPDIPMTEKEEKLLEMFIRLGVKALMWMNEKMSEAMVKISELEVVNNIDDEMEHELEVVTSQLDAIHAEFFKANKFCLYLAKNFMPEQKSNDLVAEIKERIPLTVEDVIGKFRNLFGNIKSSN